MEELEGNYKAGQMFETRVLNLETKRLEKRYYKILSVRKDRNDFILGFRVQRCEFTKIKTVIEAVDDCKDKKLLIKDVYELKPTNEDPIYYKYIFSHWMPTYSTEKENQWTIIDRLLEKDELIKTMDRK